ncbi:hypothetical protein D1BOALGB6SA_4277 [Olavius sp. associated proteobacterium Delta 1]|nr:hypothetical protein D1BOALGB6SA_4277 [Olavius sp. associated proteobacterium Delta 1]
MGKCDDGSMLKTAVKRQTKMETIQSNPIFHRSSIPLFHEYL